MCKFLFIGRHYIFNLLKSDFNCWGRVIHLNCINIKIINHIIREYKPTHIVYGPNLNGQIKSKVKNVIEDFLIPLYIKKLQSKYNYHISFLQFCSYYKNNKLHTESDYPELVNNNHSYATSFLFNFLTNNYHNTQLLRFSHLLDWRYEIENRIVKLKYFKSYSDELYSCSILNSIYPILCYLIFNKNIGCWNLTDSNQVSDLYLANTFREILNIKPNNKSKIPLYHNRTSVKLSNSKLNTLIIDNEKIDSKLRKIIFQMKNDIV